MAEGKISGEYDVVVVGAGNAGMCAALAARENGARVLVLEAAPFDERGGNSRYTAGALRFVYNGVDDLLKLCDLSEQEVATSDFGTYTTDKYYDDLGRLTDYRSNPDMAELLITKSQETLLWMRGKGIRFAPMYSRQAFKHEGKFVFWGGLALEAWGGGPGLVEGLFNSAEKNGIAVAYEARGERLIADDDGVHGVIANVEGKTTHNSRDYALSRHMPPAEVLRTVRRHWAIENHLHWQLDVLMAEDQTRNRKHNGPANLAALRRLALNVLRSDPENIPLSHKRLKARWANEDLLKLMTHMR